MSRKKKAYEKYKITDYNHLFFLIKRIKKILILKIKL